MPRVPRARPSGADLPGQPASTRERWLAVLIVLGGILLRLPHLGQGLVEIHSWRQADGAMVSANLLRDGFDLFHPRIDWVGDLPGFIGMELPLVPLLTSLLYALFGEHLALGRLVSLAFFPPACALLYLLVRHDFGARVARIALFVFVTSPLGIFYSRTLMPESAMLCAMLAALWFATRWASGGRELDRWLAVASAALAMLLKLPAGVILLPMAALAWQREGVSCLRSLRHWMALAAAIAPAALWYAHAAALAQSNEPFHLFGEENWLWSTGLGVLAETRHWFRFGLRATVLVVAPLGLVAALFGLRVVCRSAARVKYFAWGTGLLAATLLGWRGQVRHEYYQLPLVPWCAVLAALAVDRWLLVPASLPQREDPHRSLRATALSAIAAVQLVLAVAFAETRFFSERAWSLWEAGRWTHERTATESLLVAADGADPTLLYASGRRGWHFPERKGARPAATWSIERLESLRARGASHFVAVRRQRASAHHTSLLRRWVVSVLPDMGDDRLRDTDYLESHPDFRRQLDRRFPVSARGEHAVLYDLRVER